LFFVVVIASEKKETLMRIDGLDLSFEYSEDVYGYVSDYAGIDIHIQPLPLDKAFSAEVVTGIEAQHLGSFPSERWAMKAALNAAKELSALTR
jgi:hypothetical protein